TGEIGIGDLVSFVIYTAFIGGSIAGMGEMYTRIQKSLGASERLLDILEEETEVHIEKQNAAAHKKVAGHIAFDHISFAYPTRVDIEVLKSLSLKINAGQKVALVGPSGAGKSTIIQLLMRFYNIGSGSITIDGKDIRDYDIT